LLRFITFQVNFEIHLIISALENRDEENLGSDHHTPSLEEANIAPSVIQSKVDDAEPKKKHSKRRIILIVALLIPVLGALGAYQFLVEERAPRINPMHLIPSDAMFVLETNEPYKVWKQIGKTAMWKSLQKDDEWAELGKQLESLNKSLASYEKIIDVIGERSVFISGHTYRRTDHDYLMIVDTDGIIAFQKWISAFGETTKRPYKDATIFEMLDPESKETFYYTFIDGYLIGSYTYSLVEASISERQEPQLSRSFEFIDVKKQVLGNGLLRLYLNYQAVYPYLQALQGKEIMDPVIENLPFYFSGLFFDIEDESLFLEGKTNYIDSITTYFTIFPASGEGGFEIPNVLPARTAALYSFGFDSFSEFYESLESKLKSEDEYGEEYDKYKKRIENFLDISIADDFVGWLADEMAVVQLESRQKEPVPQIAFVLKAKNKELAKEKMAHLTRQVKRKTPVKFKLIDYKGYPINFMSVKGFFNLLLGKLFARFDKPYYTIIDEYVIFANEPQVLRRFIDDFIEENTLANQEPFQKFMKRMDDEHSALMYFQLPLLYGSMKNIASSTFLDYLKKSKGVLEDFPQMGMQVSPADNMMKTKILLSQKVFILPDPSSYDLPFKADTVNYDSLFKVGVGEQIEISEVIIEDFNSRKQQEKFEDGKTKYEVGVKDGKKHGYFYEYYPNGNIKVKGKYKNDLKTGVWKYYEENGDLLKKERYRKDVLAN